MAIQIIIGPGIRITGGITIGANRVYEVVDFVDEAGTNLFVTENNADIFVTEESY